MMRLFGRKNKLSKIDIMRFSVRLTLIMIRSRVVTI